MWRTLFDRLKPAPVIELALGRVRAGSKQRKVTPPRSDGGRSRAGLYLETLEERMVLSGGMVGNLVVFGDSLADAGNVALATQGTLPIPGIYSQGRFSGGPIWVDTLAKYLGAPAVQPSLAGGLDYAFAGATVANNHPAPPFDKVPTVAQQVGQYLASHIPTAKDLFAVCAGANDFFDSFSSGTPIDPSQSAAALEGSLTMLARAGARQFVVANLPPLGETPFITSLGSPLLSAAADQWTTAFNASLGQDLSKFKSDNPGVTVVGVDVASLFQQASQPNNPFGFVNTTSPVGDYLAPGTSVFIKNVTAQDAQNYLFFDGVHPTSKAHQLIGLEAAASVYDALGVHNLVVTSTADTVNPLAGGLSLREMVNLSNTMTGKQTITFNLGSGPHEIQLSGTDLSITQDLVLRGPGVGMLKISGAGRSRIFEVASNAHVVLSRVTLNNGSADKGGAVANAGQLLLDGVSLVGNTAEMGGAVYNTGTLMVKGSLLDGNTAASITGSGGALANFGASASASLFGALLINNTARGSVLAQGGAIANLGGASLSVSNTSIGHNRVDGVEAWGGGIFNDASSRLTLTASVVIGNYALGKAANGGHGLGAGLYAAKRSAVLTSFTLIAANFASTRAPDVYNVA